MSVEDKLIQAAANSTEAGERGASEKQCGFLAKLITKADEEFNATLLTAKEASSLIEGYLAASGQVSKPRAFKVEEDIDKYIKATMLKAADAIIAAINAKPKTSNKSEEKSEAKVDVNTDEIPF